MTRRVITAAAAATLGLGALVGCGGSEDSGKARAGDGQSQRGGQDNERDTGDTGDKAEDDTEGDSGGKSSDTDSKGDAADQSDETTQSSGNISAYCKAAKKMNTAVEKNSAENGAKKARAALQDVVDNAPADVQDDWKTYVEAWDELNDVRGEMKEGSSGTDQKETESARSKMESVSVSIGKDLESNCGEL